MIVGRCMPPLGSIIVPIFVTIRNLLSLSPLPLIDKR